MENKKIKKKENKPKNLQVPMQCSFSVSVSVSNPGYGALDVVL
jgi:hypothetical protein